MAQELSLPSSFTHAQLAPSLRGAAGNDELGAGIASSFGVVGYRGKVWSIKYQRNETKLMREDGDGPRGSIEVVITKSASALSKIFYESGYQDGSNAAPDCSSANGITPDPASPKRQSPTCAACPRNAWGSRVTEAGKQGKACADSKRLVIVPLQDIDNDLFGGPMLLRVPAASLKDLKSFGDLMQSHGYPFYGVGVRIGFDPQEAYPKFSFKAIRPLSDAEAQKVLALRDDSRVARILNEAVEHIGAEPAQAAPAAPASPFELPPEPKAPPAAAAPVAAPVAAPQPAPAPVVVAPWDTQPAPAPVVVAAPVQVAPVQPPMVSSVAVAEAHAGAPADFDALLDGLLKS